MAFAFRQRYDEHTQGGGDIESPGSPATQDPAGDLSVPIPQRNSEPAVMPAIDVPVISELCYSLRYILLTRTYSHIELCL